MKKLLNILWLIAIIAVECFDAWLIIDTAQLTANSMRAVILMNLVVVLLGDIGEKK